MVMSANDQYDVNLIDDRAPDTIVRVSHTRWDEPRIFWYTIGCAAAYRDNDGVLDMQAFVDDIVIPDAELEE